MANHIPYLLRITVTAEELPTDSVYPFNLPFVKDLKLVLHAPVTFFVGENGSGKSTLMEAVAALCRLPVSGGGRNELADITGPAQTSLLSKVLRLSFRRQPRDGYFFRGEFQAHFASLLDSRKQDPDFVGNPYTRFGGRSLHTQSHGEAFLATLQNRMGAGLYLLDEPEAALSPQRQLALLALIHNLVGAGKSQFIIASHSPILMTYPNAQLVTFDKGSLAPITLEETSHYSITKGILEHPGSYWKHLIRD